MVCFSRSRRSLIVALAVLAGPAALAQSSPGYFIPPSSGGAPPASGVTHHAHKVAQPPASAALPSGPVAGGDASAAAPASQTQAQLPAIPQLPALPKGAAPPTAGARRAERAGCDAEFDRGAGRAGDHPRAPREPWARRRSSDPCRHGRRSRRRSWRSAAKVSDCAAGGRRRRALQDESGGGAGRASRARDQAIQNSGAGGAGARSSRELIAVIRQVAEARGMNLVLHREQVALNVNAFDITDGRGERS